MMRFSPLRRAARHLVSGLLATGFATPALAQLAQRPFSVGGGEGGGGAVASSVTSGIRPSAAARDRFIAAPRS